MEGIALCLSTKPFALLFALPALARGIPAFKRRIAEIAPLEIAHLPVREDLVAYLRLEKASGRRIDLVTAADAAIANAVAARFGFFDAVYASSAARNLKGAKKAALLKEIYPEGFAYAGDSPADMPNWAASRAIILAGAEPATARAARALAPPIVAEFPDPPAGPKAWRTLLSPGDAFLALAIFSPLLLGRSFADTRFWTIAAIAFLLAVAVLFSAQIFAEIANLRADRRDPMRRLRPLASGAIPLHEAMMATAALGAPAIGFACVLGPCFAAILAVLFAAQLWRPGKIFSARSMCLVRRALVLGLCAALGAAILACEAAPRLLISP